MHILFICKRYYMHKDLLQTYGRFYEIPAGLAKLGHRVDVDCMSYYKSRGGTIRSESSLVISSDDATANPLANLVKHYRKLEIKIARERPDVIVAASDCYQIIIGAKLARRFAIPLVIDVYDNFYSYRASRLPGIWPLFVRSLKYAQAISVVSSQLKLHLSEVYGLEDNVHIIENAVTSEFLSAGNKARDRVQFQFAPDRIYLGTAGDLGRDGGRQTRLLVQTFISLKKEVQNITLVLAGPVHARNLIPAHDDIHYLGQLPYAQIPALFRAMDIGVINISDDHFGRYCFPQKFYEMVACRLPVVASSVGELRILLADYPELLFRSDDLQDMKRAILYQSSQRRSLTINVPTWQAQAEKFMLIIERAIRRE